jgi:hypothetical protein
MNNVAQPYRQPEATLLVVLCGDQPASPIVNAGSLYT